MTTLVLAEQDAGELKQATAHAVTAALALGGPVHVLVAGAGCAAAAAAAAKLAGVDKVLHADDPQLAQQLAEPLAALILSIAADYDALIAPATSTGKSVMPRVAALLDVMQVSDVIAIVSPNTFDRPIYAGNAVQTVTTGTTKRVLTIRTAKFAPAEKTGSAAVETLTVPALPARARFVSANRSVSDRPELGSARIVVSGGRALGSGEKFDKIILSLAGKLGAAIGASRAAVDAGYASSDAQVGQTGKIVAPDLYIAIGISGAIQHLAGMKDAKVIVAINKDADAPIFQVADYGIVGDLFEIVPQFETELEKAR
jgi:electron transfer flavoprotein alpha subunit